jgi:hypothetical protein
MIVLASGERSDIRAQEIVGDQNLEKTGRGIPAEVASRYFEDCVEGIRGPFRRGLPNASQSSNPYSSKQGPPL